MGARGDWVQFPERTEKRRAKAAGTGTNVCIGYGHSKEWKDLKDFIHDRMRLPWDEFNRVPVAGVPNTVRLATMPDTAAIAFLVLTAEEVGNLGNWGELGRTHIKPESPESYPGLKVFGARLQLFVDALEFRN